ncbi:unnamed protein product, partial [marine sediment metagenome]
AREHDNLREALHWFEKKGGGEAAAAVQSIVLLLAGTRPFD